jgi:hypothetical protein
MGADAPVQYQNFILMRDVFRCTPSELKAQSVKDIAAVLVCMDVEARFRKAKKHGKSLTA